MEHLLSTEVPPFPLHCFPTLKDLCLGVIGKFKPAALKGVEARPLESQYQDEFYRSCYMLLDRHLYLNSEWSGKKTGVA